MHTRTHIQTYTHSHTRIEDAQLWLRRLSDQMDSIYECCYAKIALHTRLHTHLHLLKKCKESETRDNREVSQIKWPELFTFTWDQISETKKLSYILSVCFSVRWLLTSLETSTKWLEVCSECVGFHLTLSHSLLPLSLFFCHLEVILGQAEVRSSSIPYFCHGDDLQTASCLVNTVYSYEKW